MPHASLFQYPISYPGNKNHVNQPQPKKKGMSRNPVHSNTSIYVVNAYTLILIKQQLLI